MPLLHVSKSKFSHDEAQIYKCVSTLLSHFKQDQVIIDSLVHKGIAQLILQSIIQYKLLHLCIYTESIEPADKILVLLV